MKKKPPEVIYDGEDVERCRQVRRELESRFKTVDELFDYCEQLVQRRGVQSAKSHKKVLKATTRPRRTATPAKR